jgi:hypothetical protein
VNRPPQLKGERRIKVRRGTEVGEATVRWWMYLDGRYTVEVDGPFGMVKATGRGAIEALDIVRTTVEPLGWFLGVQGSLPGRWATGMLGDMGGGELVYVHSLDSRDRTPVVGTFDDADPAEAVTVQEQRRWQRAWSRIYFLPPPVTEALRSEARGRPGGWVYAVDPAFDLSGAVPPHGVVGAWKVDERGEIVGEFTWNPNYRPSSQALELPPPTDPLDGAVQLAATGYGPEDAVIGRFLEREVLVTGEDRGTTVRAFSSQAHLPPGEEGNWQRVPGRELVARLPAGGEVVVNPGAPTSVRLAADDLKRRTDD